MPRALASGLLALVKAADPVSSGRVASAILLVFVVCFAGTGCRSSPPRWNPTGGGRYDRLSKPAWLELDRARQLFEDGELDRSQAVLERLVDEFPENIPVAILLQEIEIVLSGREPVVEPLPRLAVRPPPPDESPAERIRRAYRARAEGNPSAPGFVLAARVEDDALSASRLLDSALELDPDCAWAWYGKAHAAALRDDWEAARQSLSRALQLDTGHVPARRLEAWMLARGGRTDEAVDAYELWLTHAEEHPFVEHSRYVEAQLDLALLYVLDGNPRAAARLLDTVVIGDAESSRKLTILAATREAQGDGQAALEAAAEAELRDPENLLPVVQQALLYEYWLKEPRKARAAWQRLLSRSLPQEDLESLLQRTRARVRLERSDADGEDS